MTNQLSYYVVTRVLCCHLCDMLCRFTEVPKKRSAPKHFLSNPRTYCHQGQKSNSTASYNQNVSRVSMSLALGTKALSQSPFSRNKGNMLLNSLQASEYFEYIYYSGTLIIKDVRCCTRYSVLKIGGTCHSCVYNHGRAQKMILRRAWHCKFSILFVRGNKGVFKRLYVILCGHFGEGLRPYNYNWVSARVVRWRRGERQEKFRELSFHQAPQRLKKG